MKWFRRQREESFACQVCGKVHTTYPTDFGWMLPDIVWKEDAENRQKHLDWSTDICYFREKWYLRGVLEVPFQFSQGCFGWGIWAEVNEQAMAELRGTFDADGSHLPREQGVIACQIPNYSGVLGLPVEIQFGPSNLRPLFYLPANLEHPLAVHHRKGMSEREYHDVLGIIAP